MNHAWKWNPANEARARKRFGIKTYRPGQQELIHHVMAGNDALGILPTGGGKSLCYQLPALFLPNAVLVVSPLISLMQDQHEKLTDNHVPAVKLNSTLNAAEERQSIKRIKSRSAELIYVTPERLESAEYLELLKQMKRIASPSGVMIFGPPISIYAMPSTLWATHPCLRSPPRQRRKWRPIFSSSFI
jgi:superfamily II DNA helicase RecQ